MKLVRNLFLTDTDLCKPVVIGGFDRNLHLFLLIFLSGA